MRKFLWVVIPSAIFAFTLGFLWHIGEKKLTQFLVLTAKNTTKEKLNWNLDIGKVNLHLAPPGIDVIGIRASPPKGATWIKPVSIKSVGASLDFLSLLAGQIKFSIIKINGISTTLSVGDIPSSEKPIERLPIKELFEALEVIPIKMFFIEDTQLQLNIPNSKNTFSLNGDILLQSAPQNINYRLKLNLEDETSKTSQTNPIRILSKGILGTKNLNINQLELTTGSSKVELQAEFINFQKVITSPLLSGFTDISINLQDINHWLNAFSLTQYTGLNGLLKSQGNFQLIQWNRPNAELKTSIRDLTVGQINAGSIDTQAKLAEHQLALTDVQYQHPAGNAEFENIRWNLNTDEFRSQIDLKSLDLQKLFQELNLLNIPVDLLVSSRLDCEGKILKPFGLFCKGNVRGTNLDVRSQFEKRDSTIIKLNTFHGEGTININSEGVSYSTSVVLPRSKGQSQGTIKFATGFIIDFDSDNFNFADMSPLSGLLFEGAAKLKGRTQGDSQTATLEIGLSAKDFWFENFGLGSIDGKVIYQKGHLLIDVPKATLTNSPYVASLNIDLSNSTIKGHVESPDIRAEDAIKALSRRVPMPFTLSGHGRTRAQFEGPFELGKLTYKFEGYLQKGDIQGETFDELKWDLAAKNGQVYIENNTLQKGKALITVNGRGAPNGHVALEVNGNNFKLENSTFLSQYVKTLGGDIDFHSTITNHILKPDVYLEAKISRTTLGESELPDSKIIFETDSFGKSLTLDLIGHQLRMDLDLPYKTDDPARLFVEIQKFDYTDFIGLILGSPLRNDYTSLISMRMDIQSDNNDIFAASGFLRVDELLLSRGEHSLRNSKPMFIQFDKGLASLQNFSIKGPKSEITATGSNFSPKNLKLNLGGSIDLRLIQLFTPFLDDISGPVKGQISVGGSLESPEVYGNVDLNEVALKLKDFPPVFDHINSHLEFSQKRIIIESIRGSLAGGTLLGDGAITINGVKDVKVDVKAQLRNLQMEVPENVQSSGNADVVLSGSTFPYTLSGSYRITQAFIDKDFSSDSAGTNLRQSIYLPKNIAISSFDPIVLDLQVLLDRKVEIRNPQMSGFLSGQIQVKGPPSSPILLGSIKTLPQSQLFFRDKIFDIQSGLIRFTDPTEINPELYFTARSLVDKYEINLLLQGRAKNPQLVLSSQPTLPEQDIISLLALGLTTQKLDSQIQSSQQAAQTGYQLGSAIISANPLNKEIKQSLGVDVKFSSGFDDTKNVALPRVTVSKDLIPRKLNASATSSFSEKQQYDVRFQYLLNDRLSTVVTYEKAEGQAGSSVTGTSQPETSIFGLDLEYKVEFK
ncbi:MAG: hypothetical protein RJB66_2541 [Pseudomonadota bacterium]